MKRNGIYISDIMAYTLVNAYFLGLDRWYHDSKSKYDYRCLRSSIYRRTHGQDDAHYYCDWRDLRET